MSKSAGSIFVDLLLRDTKYQEGMKRAGKATSDFEKGIKNLARELAPILGVAGFTAITNRALEAADSIAKLSVQLGLTAEQYQKYAYAAKLGGVDTERFSAAVGFLNNKIAEGKLPYADTSSALLDISDKLKNAKDGIERARIASENFGAKAGRVLIPALIGGSESLRDLGREAEDLGIIFSTQLTQDTEKFKDQIEILGMVFTNNFQIGLLEAFVGKSGEIRDIYTDPEFLESARALGEAFGALAKAAIGLAKVPAYLRAIFIEMPSLAGKALGNKITGNEILNNPNVSFQKPKTVDVATFKIEDQVSKDAVRITTEHKKVQDELSRIYERNRGLILDLDNATIRYMDSVAELKQLLDGNKITLEQYNDAVKRLDEELAKNTQSFNSWGIDITEFGKQAASNIQDAFADFLFDPFADGTKGMLKGFIDVVRRMIAEAQAAQLAKYLLGDVAGGTGAGALGGIFDSISGGLGGVVDGFGGFFADGGYLSPGQWGVAGEEGAELLYGGKTGVTVMNQSQIGGKGDTYIDARGADMSAIRKLESIIYERTSRDAILGTVMQGQMRGAI